MKVALFFLFLRTAYALNAVNYNQYKRYDFTCPENQRNAHAQGLISRRSANPQTSQKAAYARQTYPPQAYPQAYQPQAYPQAYSHQSYRSAYPHQSYRSAYAQPTYQQGYPQQTYQQVCNQPGCQRCSGQYQYPTSQCYSTEQAYDRQYPKNYASQYNPRARVLGRLQTSANYLPQAQPQSPKHYGNLGSYGSNSSSEPSDNSIPDDSCFGDIYVVKSPDGTIKLVDKRHRNGNYQRC